MAKFAHRESLRLRCFTALASTISIVDPCIDIRGCSGGQDEQFDTPLRPSKTIWNI